MTADPEKPASLSAAGRASTEGRERSGPPDTTACDVAPVELAGSSKPICAAVGVTKRFGGVTAIEDVSFHVYGGETHAVVGENGAGKSSLMKVLQGLYHPDEGHVEVDGQRVQLRGARHAEAVGIYM